MISAKIVADSIANNIRITTFELRYPKFIHGELMTHRMFSRNASSSRAIPTKKYLEEVRYDELRACPVFWGINKPGMQAAEELTGEELDFAKEQWRIGALEAAHRAETMLCANVHKQIINRILEPFIHINVVVTATEFMNFFGLRLDEGAQPEIRVLAEEMWKARNESIPLSLKYNEWHLPYLSSTDFQELELDLERIKVSVARCARVSYKSFDTGKASSFDEDIKLYNRLLGSQPIHASPAEHQATPDILNSDIDGKHWENPDKHGNFTGWIQYRKTLVGESIATLPDKYKV